MLPLGIRAEHIPSRPYEAGYFEGLSRCTVAQLLLRPASHSRNAGDPCWERPSMVVSPCWAYPRQMTPPHTARVYREIITRGPPLPLGSLLFVNHLHLNARLGYIAKSTQHQHESTLDRPGDLAAVRRSISRQDPMRTRPVPHELPLLRRDALQVSRRCAPSLRRARQQRRPQHDRRRHGLPHHMEERKGQLPRHDPVELRRVAGRRRRLGQHQMGNEYVLIRSPLRAQLD